MDRQTLQILIPLLIVVPVLYWRNRKMSRAQPLKLNRLWIRPALILAACVLALAAPHHGAQAARQLSITDWAVLALTGIFGAVGGWYYGRAMGIETHPENGTLMVKGGNAATLVLGVLILLRMGLNTGARLEAQAWHLDVLLISDASIVFSAALFTMRSVEMYLRAKKVMGQRRLAA
jgi:hypothetical protein